MPGDIIVVNSFAFCKDHGEEFCHRCSYDHRPTNNYQIENELEEVHDNLAYDVDGRTSINAYDHGAVQARNRSESYQCKSHGRVDCHQCFNWADIIKEESKQAASQEQWLKKRERFHNAYE